MNQAVVVDCVRTPIGRSHPEKGVFRDVRSDDLAATVVRALVQRTGIEPSLVEDVVLGNTQQQGEQGFDVARTVALLAGLPNTTSSKNTAVPISHGPANKSPPGSSCPCCWKPPGCWTRAACGTIAMSIWD